MSGKAFLKKGYDMKRFDITYFYGPEPDYLVKPEVLSAIKEAGFTFIPLNTATEIHKKVLPMLKELGLGATVQDSRISEIYYKKDFAAVDATVKAVVADYAAYDNLLGYEIVDEPSAADFPMLAALVEAFRRYAPDKETVINLFPNYANPGQLGTPDYETHLTRFIREVNPHFLSYDHYHFLGRESAELTKEGIGEREYGIREAAQREDRAGFFENIESVSAAAKRHGLDAMLIVLLVEHGPYRNLTRAELLWEVNMCLAYGMRRLSYFTYWTPPYDDYWRYTNAICDREGNKMPHYFDVQTINRLLYPVGQGLFEREWQAAFHIGRVEPGGTLFEGYGDIAAIEGDFGVVGFYDDGSFYLVNGDYRKEATFRIVTGKSLFRFADGDFLPCDTTLTLGAGEGIRLKTR